VAEEKTRIIPRSQADPATTEPRRIGDKIVFFCPNGDKVVVAAQFAGKRGLCTKCKVPVVIPNPGGEEAVEPAASPEEPTEPPEATAEEAVSPAAEESAAEGGEGVKPAGQPAGEWQFVSEVEGSHAGFEPQPSRHWDMPAPGAPFGEPGQPSEHPAARLAARLWMERDQGGIFELHLTGGSVILPEWYEPNWSRGSHGLFASQAADGSITLTAVAWDTIEKIVVRQVPAVPDGMFE